MTFAGAVTIVGVLLSASPGRAQSPPAWRSAVPIPVATAELAAAVNSDNAHRSLLLLDVVRILFDAPNAPQDPNSEMRARVVALLRQAASPSAVTVPLPLTPAIWRESILRRRVPDAELIAEIISTRETALLYYGLSALDDETLAWLAGDRETLALIGRHPGAFAAFGRSLRVRDGCVVVPGGPAAAARWQQVVGADPSMPRAFVRALLESDRGRTAFLYDTIAHLDPARRAFALAGALDALAGVFRGFAPEWDAETRPFGRPQLDPSLLLKAIRLGRDGRASGPAGRDIWERVFRDDGGIDLAFREVPPWRPPDTDRAVDAAWLAARVHDVAYTTGRRRLETFLFGQRTFAAAGDEPHVVASVLRAFASMPALLLTLERMGVRDAATLLEAARRARAVHDTGEARAISVFQSAIAIAERGVRSGALTPGAARALVVSLVAVPVSSASDYERRLAEWFRSDLFRAAPQPPLASSDPVEEGVLAILAGARDGRPAPRVEWEGVSYRVDPAAAEMARLRRIRARQEGLTLDAAIAALLGAGRGSANDAREASRAFAQTLRSVVYAAHLGDPEGPALAAENVAVKHDLGVQSPQPGAKPMNAWRLPIEVFGGNVGWHVQGSLLGLDHALRRLSLRRLDAARLPDGPTMPVLERRTAMLTVALANPHALTDEGRDRAAAALARGRKRLDALDGDPARADAILSDAGLGGLRREAVKWALAHAPGEAPETFSLVELLWLGGAGGLDEWGAAALPTTGCLCLRMPEPGAWEDLSGRPSGGLLATLGADVNLRLAEALAARRLPAALMPAVLAFAMQDALDGARLAYLDDWQAFGRAARAIAEHRIDDYIAALTADGPLVPAPRGTGALDAGSRQPATGN